MAFRNIYLKIEKIPEYSPVHPVEKEPPGVFYSRDCMYGEGHENGVIPLAEVEARTLDAITYREYFDSDFLIPKPDKMVEADVNEPIFERRIGTVIYTKPGDTLYIHVLNGDSMPHTLHVHGLEFGIDSDGAWPFGTQNEQGARSDRICPGEKWTYTFNVTKEMIGVWPFHDHFPMAAQSIDRGLFGGIVVQSSDEVEIPFLDVLPKEYEDLLHKYVNIKDLFDGRIPKPKPQPDPLPYSKKDLIHIKDQIEFLKEWLGQFIGKAPKKKRRALHVPIFFHVMKNNQSKPVFDTGDIDELGGENEKIFNDQGSFDYFCTHHPTMEGTINVVLGGPALATITILDNPQMGFYPPAIDVGIGGTVKWINQSQFHHTATSKDGAALSTHCFNGRGFVGNSPTIDAQCGQKIKWYVFNLDVGHEWHNFHTHSQRWRLGNENIDVRSIGPAESFTVETEAPPVIILNDEMKKLQKDKKKPRNAKLVQLKGDFLFHCHVHNHMMNGMVGLVRSHQKVWLTPDMINELKKTKGLPLDDGTNNCPPKPDGCLKLGDGQWEEVEGQPEVIMMHSVLLPKQTKILYWGYTRTDQSRLWDYNTETFSSPVNQPASLPNEDLNTSNLWSAEHAFLNNIDGEVLVHGGLTSGPNNTPTESFIFNPQSLEWSKTFSTTDARFYSTSIPLPDGKIITLYGSGSKTYEIFTPGTGWSTPVNLPFLNYRYYPWTYLLPDGRLFIAGPESPTRRFDWQNPIDDPNNTWITNQGTRSTSGQDGTSVLLPLRLPNYDPHVMIMGGRNNLGIINSTEIINLSLASPSWDNLSDMNEARENLTSILLPDGKVMVAGGISGSPGIDDGGPVEIFDPQNPNDGWKLGPIMNYPRVYHSSMILLPDGSVLCGGDPQQAGVPTPHERYYPGYYFVPRPEISNISNNVQYGNTFDIQTPDASNITEVIVMSPGAVTHGFNMTQRIVECEIVNAGGGTVQARVPPNGNITPPGYYLVFILNSNRIPSIGKWIRITS